MRNFRPYQISLIAFLFLTPLTSAYTFRMLQYPGSSQTYATGLNSNGAVVGYYVDAATGLVHGFTERKGTFKDVSLPRASGTWVTGINNSEHICGYVHSNGITKGFELKGSSLKTFSIPKVRGTFTQGINDSGNLAGYANTGRVNAPVYEAFSLANDSSTTPAIIKVTGSANTWAFGINNNGDVVGYAGADLNSATPLQGFIYTASTKTLQTVSAPAATQTRFYGINDKGEAVGYTVDSTGSPTGFTYRNGTFTPFTIPGNMYALPQAVNNNGVVVGYGATNSTTVVSFVAVP